MHAENEVHIDHARSFPGWNSWKETIRQGMDCAGDQCTLTNIRFTSEEGA